MLFNFAASGRVSARTRLPAYGLFGYCSVMVFLGPSVAEFGLAALGCPGIGGYAQSGCRGLAMLPTNALVPWLSVVPPVATTFLLLQQGWMLIAGWLVAIVLSAQSDRSRQLPSAAQHSAPRTRELRSASSTGRATPTGQGKGLLPGSVALTTKPMTCANWLSTNLQYWSCSTPKECVSHWK